MLRYTYSNPRKLIITDFCKYSQQDDTKKKEEENRKLSRLKRLRRLKNEFANLKTFWLIGIIVLFFVRRFWLAVHKDDKDWLISQSCNAAVGSMVGTRWGSIVLLGSIQHRKFFPENDSHGSWRQTNIGRRSLNTKLVSILLLKIQD